MSRPSRLRRLSGIGNGLLSERCKSGHERAAADVAILLTNAPAQKREKGYGTARRRTRALRPHRTPTAPEAAGAGGAFRGRIGGPSVFIARCKRLVSGQSSGKNSPISRRADSGESDP